MTSSSTGTDAAVTRSAARMADGRQIFYFDEKPHADRVLIDSRDLPPVIPASQVRYDPLTGEWVGIAGHRQSRIYHPPADACPLCPSSPTNLSEIPSPSYDVVVFENRFPSFAGAGETASDGGLFDSRSGNGRCEVVCFTADHHTTLSCLPVSRMRTVIEAWADRTAALSALPGVEQVFCFENRGVEIGVTLAHPHGQIYGYPFVTPKTATAIHAAQAHRARFGTSLFGDILTGELADGSRVVTQNEHWVAFVPFAARWPVEVHLYPRRQAARPDRARGHRALGARRGLPGSHPADGGHVRRHPARDHRRTSGARACGERRFLAAPGGLLDPSGGGEIEVPGRFGIGNGSLCERHQSGNRGPAAARRCAGGPMKALVVGGAGYIGSVVTRLLVEQGHQVVVLDDCSTGHADSVPDGVELQQRDITEVADVLRDGGFDAVLHFAAKSLVGESVAKPSIYWRTNVYGTRVLLGRDGRARGAPAGLLLDGGDLRRARVDSDHRGRPHPADQHLRRHQTRGRHDDHRRMCGHPARRGVVAVLQRRRGGLRRGRAARRRDPPDSDRAGRAGRTSRRSHDLRRRLADPGRHARSGTTCTSRTWRGPTCWR